MADPAISPPAIPDVLAHNHLAAGPTASAETARKAGLAALVGTAMEWYDFFLFTTASALIFGSQYFISGSATTGLLYSFGTMAVGFVARPVGGLIFGHLGDRLGRRPVMLITIVGIGAATGLIGVLPTFMSIGHWAPILLIVLRVCQGLSAGGEWGGAITAAVEAAPADRRARFASFPQIGSPIGTLLSSGGFFVVTTFAISYGTGTLGLPSTLMLGLGATLCAAAFEILVIIFFGRLGERIGSALAPRLTIPEEGYRV